MKVGCGTKSVEGEFRESLAYIALQQLKTHGNVTCIIDGVLTRNQVR